MLNFKILPKQIILLGSGCQNPFKVHVDNSISFREMNLQHENTSNLVLQNSKRSRRIPLQ